MNDAPSHPLFMQEALQEHFGFSTFLAGQEEVVRHVLEGEDVVVIMPTGSGKSLCYQLAAFLLDGVTLVVSPLIALMKDQVDGLAAQGLPATFINSSLAVQEMHDRMARMRAGEYKLVYVAPERFRVHSFMEALEEIEVAMLAVDEAHCISQWGHDFRPDYLALRGVLEKMPRARVMALTATATPHVRADIVTQLGLGEPPRREPRVLVQGFARPNLLLAVHQTATHQQKLACIKRTLERYPTGIIYCATRKQTETVCGQLRKAGIESAFYHAGLDDEERKTTQEQFMRGDMPVVVATNAFGMGVDRADLRFVIHWDVPGSIEAYYQEVGRAGRDGEESRCELLFNYADVRTQEFFIEGANPEPGDVMRVWSVIRAACNLGPVTRSMKEWTGLVPGTTNAMMVRTVVGILERAGLVQLEIEAGQRTYTLSLVPGADLAVLEDQFPHMAEKRRRDERKLKTMLRYVSDPGCRHAFILNYFGEHDASVPCGACDHCGREVGLKTREPTEDEWVVIQKILSCVARLKGRFGRARVVQVLVGSREAAVLERNLDQLPTYGALKSCKTPYVRAVLDELIRDGSLQLSGDEYPVVGLTPRGREVMWRKTACALAWPEPPSPDKRSAKKGRAHTAPEDYDEELFGALKAWRLETARAEKVPAYVVLHDATLKAIAAARPGNLADLETLHGMGPSRVAKYGDALLELVDQHTGP